jgi:hypothetical protein
LALACGQRKGALTRKPEVAGREVRSSEEATNDRGAPLPNPPTDADNRQFTGRDAPLWLAFLAELVRGLETPSADEGKLTRDQIAEKARRETRERIQEDLATI